MAGIFVGDTPTVEARHGMVGARSPSVAQRDPTIGETGLPLDDGAEVVTKYWTRYTQWSALADQLKREITRWRTASLILACAGALLQTAAAVMGKHGTALAVAGALALVFVPFVARYFLTPEQTRKWLRSRSAAEALKSLVYRFVTRAAPFTDTDRVARLSTAGRRVEASVASLVLELASIEAAESAPPGSLDADGYITKRVRDQIEGYYRKQAQRHARLARRFRALELAAAALAAALGAIATVLKLASDEGSGVGTWVAVITTIGGAVAAHAAVSRHEQQALIYLATARQLEDLLSDWETDDRHCDTTAWSVFVNACEDAITAENDGWMAKLDPETQHAR